MLVGRVEFATCMRGQWVAAPASGGLLEVSLQSVCRRSETSIHSFDPLFEHRTELNMSDKPSYLSKLNAIANGERGGHELFSAWSGATKNKRLKKTLDKVAVREMEHSWAFTKRLSELGFDLRPPADESGRQALTKQIALLSSDASDEAKFASFGIKKSKKKGSKKAGKKDQADAPDKLLQILSDSSIDPTTAALMGRFIAEERDTGRLLRKAFKDCRKG